MDLGVQTLSFPELRADFPLGNKRARGGKTVSVIRYWVGVQRRS